MVVRIRGVVVPVGWDDDGNVGAVAISTDTEEEIRIEGPVWDGKLKKLLHEPVEVSGRLYGRRGAQRIAVQQCILRMVPDDAINNEIFTEDGI